MKRIVLLGATGSVGSHTIAACAQNIHAHKIIAISFHNNYAKAILIAEKLKINHLIGKRPAGAPRELIFHENYETAILQLKPDIVVNGVSGFAGLKYTLTTLKHNIDLAVANKESLIVGYQLIAKLLKTKTCKLIPLDSEHFSIYNACASNYDNIKCIWITASGGQFYDGNSLNFNVPNANKLALQHPTWRMGKEITVNSATLMNKAFELLEAMNLFQLQFEQVKVVWHKQSLIHGAVALHNGVLVIIGFATNIAIPINAALNFPEVNTFSHESLDFAKIGTWNFSPMSTNTLEAFRIAKKASSSERGAIVIVAANEFFVQQFLEGKIDICDILPRVSAIQDYYDIPIKTKLNNLTDIEHLFADVQNTCGAYHFNKVHK